MQRRSSIWFCIERFVFSSTVSSNFDCAPNSDEKYHKIIQKTWNKKENKRYLSRSHVSLDFDCFAKSPAGKIGRSRAGCWKWDFGHKTKFQTFHICTSVWYLSKYQAHLIFVTRTVSSPKFPQSEGDGSWNIMGVISFSLLMINYCRNLNHFTYIYG